MRFHLLGLAHLPVTSKYPACAFTNKVHKLSRMLMAKGHEVYLYGCDYHDTECTEFIQCNTVKDIKKSYGSGDNRFELGYDHTKRMGFRHDFNLPRTECTRKFDATAIEEINKRKKDDDYLLLSQGVYQKPIADAVQLFLTCEFGIGYRGSYAKYRAFESAFLQNFTYGKESEGASINGDHYHRVIPNYFDPNDFEFCDKPKDYLLFMARLVSRKGIEIAMRVSKELDMKLLVAGQGDWKGVKTWGADAYYLGMLGIEERKKYLREAKAFFLPTLYLEPFGGAAVEAMLSGTPAITTDFGAFPETNKNGVSGYRCDTLRDFVDNTKKAMELDRSGVYDWAKQYLMPNVNELYEKWWNDLYNLYLSAKQPATYKGWSKL